MPGFTLIELLVVVVIVAILASLAAPSFSAMIANQRTRAAGTDLYAALTLARSEAIKRNLPVSLVPVSSDNWAAGWRIPNPTDSGHPILEHAALSNGSVTGPAAVVYLASGRVRADTRPSFEVSFPQAVSPRCVQVDLSGRVMTTSAKCPAP
ncbi:GspH/FimT family pseudopilin [Massilia sp. LXY-6]|uniref:GspH/FimT family pseudopilin n=1 Tax=Massilia sp. LXY-6 TaxID=3379823 RepID=UPI003EDF4CAA